MSIHQLLFILKTLYYYTKVERLFIIYNASYAMGMYNKQQSKMADMYLYNVYWWSPREIEKLGLINANDLNKIEFGLGNYSLKYRTIHLWDLELKCPSVSMSPLLLVASGSWLNNILEFIFLVRLFDVFYSNSMASNGPPLFFPKGYWHITTIESVAIVQGHHFRLDKKNNRAEVLAIGSPPNWCRFANAIFLFSCCAKLKNIKFF